MNNKKIKALPKSIIFILTIFIIFNKLFHSFMIDLDTFPLLDPSKPVYLRVYSLASAIFVLAAIWLNFTKRKLIFSIIIIAGLIAFEVVHSTHPEIKYQIEYAICLDTGDCPEHIKLGGG